VSSLPGEEQRGCHPAGGRKPRRRGHRARGHRRGLAAASWRPP